MLTDGTHKKHTGSNENSRKDKQKSEGQQPKGIEENLHGMII